MINKSFIHHITACPGLDPQYIINDASVPDGYCPFIFASDLHTPRAIYVMENRDILVLERDLQQVTGNHLFFYF